MVRRGGGNKTKEYSRELKTVGLDSDPYDLPKNQWSTLDIKYMDIYQFRRLFKAMFKLWSYEGVLLNPILP